MATSIDQRAHAGSLDCNSPDDWATRSVRFAGGADRGWCSPTTTQPVRQVIAARGSARGRSQGHEVVTRPRKARYDHYPAACSVSRQAGLTADDITFVPLETGAGRRRFVALRVDAVGRVCPSTPRPSSAAAAPPCSFPADFPGADQRSPLVCGRRIRGEKTPSNCRTGETPGSPPSLRSRPSLNPAWRHGRTGRCHRGPRIQRIRRRHPRVSALKTMRQAFQPWGAATRCSRCPFAALQSATSSKSGLGLRPARSHQPVRFSPFVEACQVSLRSALDQPLVARSGRHFSACCCSGQLVAASRVVDPLFLAQPGGVLASPRAEAGSRGDLVSTMPWRGIGPRGWGAMPLDPGLCCRSALRWAATAGLASCWSPCLV